MNEQNLNRARGQVGKLENGLIDDLQEGWISRRQFLVRGSVLGMGAGLMGAILAACGDDDGEAGEPTAPAESAGTAESSVATESTEAPTSAEASAPATEPASEPAPATGGTIRIASQTPGGPLDPVAMADLGTYTMIATAFEYLAGPGDGAALAPMLAESWSPNGDGSVWTFNLRQGVKWHDGTDFTSADVVATLDRLAESNLKAYIVAGAAVAVDDFTVEVTLNAPDGQWPYQVSIYNPQSVITPASFTTGSTLDAVKTGTGAFKLDSFDPATGATFLANEEWWGGTPAIAAAEFIFSEDIGTMVTAMAAGEVDALIQFSALGGEALLDNPDVTVETIRGAAHRQIWMNVREGTFTDPKVREAVALGIDRQALIDTLFNGAADIGNDHPIAPVYETFDDSLPQRERDVARATELLAEAGKEGLALTFHAPDLQEIKQLAELVQAQLSEIGMQLELNIEPTSTFYDRWCKVYDSTNEPAGCDGGEEFGIVDYGNRGTPDVYLVKAYATGEWNSSHYASEEFRAAVSEYQAALELEPRRAAVKKIQEIAHRDIPYVIPYFYSTLIAYKTGISGIRATGLGHYYLGTATMP